METHPLRSYRTEHGITLDDLASRCATSPATISRIETRRQTPSIDLISRLIAATDGAIRADDFLPREAAQ